MSYLVPSPPQLQPHERARRPQQQETTLYSSGHPFSCVRVVSPLLHAMLRPLLPFSGRSLRWRAPVPWRSMAAIAAPIAAVAAAAAPVLPAAAAAAAGVAAGAALATSGKPKGPLRDTDNDGDLESSEVRGILLLPLLDSAHPASSLRSSWSLPRTTSPSAPRYAACQTRRATADLARRSMAYG
jgi:hypothetical protein